MADINDIDVDYWREAYADNPEMLKLLDGYLDARDIIRDPIIDPIRPRPELDDILIPPTIPPDGIIRDEPNPPRTTTEKETNSTPTPLPTKPKTGNFNFVEYNEFIAVIKTLIGVGNIFYYSVSKQYSLGDIMVYETNGKYYLYKCTVPGKYSVPTSTTFKKITL